MLPPSEIKSSHKTADTRVAVIIATKNSASTIEQTLLSLVPSVDSGYIESITIVDDRSRDATIELASKYHVKILDGAGRGFLAAYENGWRNTPGDLLIFLDSDACLRSNFFPSVLSSFEMEPKLGILGIPAESISTNELSKMVGQWWDYRYERLHQLSKNAEDTGWFDKIYHKLIWLGEPQVSIQGPCYIIRRQCLESVSGFPRSGDDTLVSRLIVLKGWKAGWYHDKLVLHSPRMRFRSLTLKYLRYGSMGGSSFKQYDKFGLRLARAFSCAFAPIMGARIAARFGNPMQLPLYTILVGVTNGVGHLLALSNLVKVSENPPTG